MSEEDERLVQEALHCAAIGQATHWPTVANVLADEVDRLRVENAALRGAAETLLVDVERDNYGRLVIDEDGLGVFESTIRKPCGQM
jgi:hypothetical protein